MSNRPSLLLADNRRMLGKLLVVALAMFGFGFALVPCWEAAPLADAVAFAEPDEATFAVEGGSALAEGEELDASPQAASATTRSGVIECRAMFALITHVHGPAVPALDVTFGGAC